MVTAVLFVFCALLANPDRFQSIKFSVTGVETTARKTIEQVQLTLDKLQRMEVAFAKANLNQLAMSGQLLIGINTADKFAIRNQIVSSLKEAGVSEEEILDSQAVWINLYCAMILDQIKGALGALPQSAEAKNLLDALPVDPAKNLPIPSSVEEILKNSKIEDTNVKKLIAEYKKLIAEYKKMWTTGSMTNPNLIPFNEQILGHVATSPVGLKPGQTYNNGGIPAIAQ